MTQTPHFFEGIDLSIKVRKIEGIIRGEGAYYAMVDGEKVGENGRAFWKTHREAYNCGHRIAMKKRNLL